MLSFLSVLANAVVTSLGLTKQTLTLSFLNSACQHCVMPLTANFDAAYTVPLAKPFKLAVEAILIIFPDCCALKKGSSSCVNNVKPKTFVLYVLNKSFSVISPSKGKTPMPALFTKTSIDPSKRSITSLVF